MKMSVIIDKYIPSVVSLAQEEKFSLYIGKGHKFRAQDTLRVVIVNLMPNNEEAEKHILKMLGKSSFKIEVSFLLLRTQSKINHKEHLNTYYKTFEELKKQKIDGMIILGASLEHLEFQEIDYWEELKEIMDYAKEHISSTLFICWAVAAGLYHYYALPKKLMEKKVFGVFAHDLNIESKLFLKFEHSPWNSQSRFIEYKREDIQDMQSLKSLSEGKDSGIFVIASKDKKQIFMAGHLEYDQCSIKGEYQRNINKGVELKIPINYFLKDDSSGDIVNTWDQQGVLFYNNWLQYYVKKDEFV